MFVRIASAAVGIPLGILIVFGWGGMLFPLVIVALAMIGLNEFYRGARRMGAEPLDWIGRGVCLLFIAGAREASAASGDRMNPGLLVLLMLLFMLCLLIEVLRPQRAPIRNLGATILGALYVGMFSPLVLLRFSNPQPLVSRLPAVGHSLPWLLRFSNPQPLASRLPSVGHSLPWLDTMSSGAWLVLFLLLTIWACDTGAYFTGRLLGKHKLAPSLSPGKTIEGLFGGLAGATAVSLLTGGWVGFSIAERVEIGLILGLCSVIGDLAESAMKREIGIKDFGSLIPGHGGVLDRFDSLLFAAPALYFFILTRG